MSEVWYGAEIRNWTLASRLQSEYPNHWATMIYFKIYIAHSNMIPNVLFICGKENSTKVYNKNSGIAVRLWCPILESAVSSFF